jgi:hypothetical protein
MRRSAWLRLLVGSWFAFAVAAQELPTSATVTEPGRTLHRALDVVLGGGERDVDRTIVVLVDPSAGLAQAGFHAAFQKVLEQNRAALVRTRLGLGIVGRKEVVTVPPTAEHARVITALGEALAHPAGEFLDVYADVRTALAAFGTGGGERVLFLVTLENGDVESDVDGTARDLQRAKVRCEVLSSEATLADSYWAARPYQQKPRNTTLTGADGAVIDVPWGWLFQFGSANEVTPAGFAMWGLTRLAAATGGRVFLYAAAAQTRHECALHGRCLFCKNDHLPVDDEWSAVLVDRLGPSALARSDAHDALGADPCFRAMVDAWRAAAEAGLVNSAPGLKLTTSGAEPDRARPGRDLDLTDGAAFERHAKRADEAAAKAAQIGERLDARLAAIAAGTAQPRCEAAARYTRVLLQLTRVNLITFAGWCREVAPGLFGRDAVDPLLPEIAAVARDDRPIGIGYSNFCLCHGVQPFFAVELPGRPALRAELELLDRLYREPVRAAAAPQRHRAVLADVPRRRRQAAATSTQDGERARRPGHAPPTDARIGQQRRRRCRSDHRRWRSMTRALGAVIAVIAASVAVHGVGVAQQDASNRRAALVEQLAAAAPAARSQAYNELVHDRDPEVVTLVGKRIQAMPPEGQQLALYVLQQHPLEVTRPVYARLLGAERPLLRAHAAAALVRGGDRERLELLANAVTAAPSTERAAVLATLWNIADPAVAAAVRGYLVADAAVPVVVAALEHLRHLEPAPSAASTIAVQGLLEAANHDLRAAALAWLVAGQNGAKHARELAGLLAEPQRFWRIERLLPRDRAYPAVLADAFVAALAQPRAPHDIGQLVPLVKSTAPDRLVPCLRELLGRAGNEVRNAALAALVALPGGLEAKELRELLQVDAPEQQLVAAALLRRMDDESGLPIALALARQAGPQRGKALETLGGFRQREVVPVLIDGLDAPEPVVRRQAWQALQLVLPDLLPYRRFAFERCGYDPVAADRSQGLATIRAWWTTVQ